MRRWLIAAAALCLLALAPLPALATNCGTGTGTCFVLAAGGNWNTSGTWSDTDGGASCACTPATGDQVFITSNSGNNTINAALSVTAADWNGFTGTTTHNSAITLTVTGNDAAAAGGVAFRLATGMTYTRGSAVSSALAFTSTSGTTTITSGGKATSNITLNGVGGKFSLGDNLTVNAAGTITLTNGEFTANGKNVSTGLFSSSNANTRVVTMGAGTWTLTGTTGSIWDYTTATGLTHNPDTATLNISATGTGTRTVLGNSKTFSTLNVGADTNTVGAVVFFSSSVTATTFSAACPVAIVISSGTALTTTTAALNGTAYNCIVSLQPSSTSNATLAGTLTATWVTFSRITFTATQTATNSIDLRGNTNITINGPAVGGGGSRCIGC